MPLLGQGGMRATAVVVAGEHQQAAIKVLQLLQGFPVGGRIAAWKIGAAGAALAQEQEVAGEEPTAQTQRHAVLGVARRVHDVYGFGADHQPLAVLQSEVPFRDAGSGEDTVVGTGPIAKQGATGQVVGVGVRVEGEAKGETTFPEHAEVVVLAPQHGIHQCGFALVGDQVGAAAAIVQLLEDHGTSCAGLSEL
jgi:hypothetical protein